MINTQDFKNLASIQDDICVSVYIPTYRANHVQEDHLRFKNALSEAVKKLSEKGMDKDEAQKLLKKAYNLLENRNFWRHLSEGLAVFITKDSFEYHILPVDVNPVVYIGKEFYLRPIIPVLTGNTRFFLLALSQEEVLFFEANKHSITAVNTDDLVPENIMEATFNERGQEEALQSRSADRFGQGIFHGHGEPNDQQNEQLEKYFRQIDDGLMKMLHDERAPMVIAAVDYLVPIFKKVSNYQNITKEHVSGNPDELNPARLHEAAWEKVSGTFQDTEQQAKEDFSLYLSKDKASFSPHEVIPAAINGRVQTLFVDKDEETWGEYNEDTASITIHEQQQENSLPLLELAAKNTFLNSGKVYNLPRSEMPQATSAVNALFRY